MTGADIAAGFHYQIEHLRRAFDPEKLRDGVKGRKPAAHPWISEGSCHRSEAQIPSCRFLTGQLHIGKALQIERPEIGKRCGPHNENASVRDSVGDPASQPCIEGKSAKDHEEPDANEHRSPGIEEKWRTLPCRRDCPENSKPAPKQAERNEKYIARCEQQTLRGRSGPQDTLARQ